MRADIYPLSLEAQQQLERIIRLHGFIAVDTGSHQRYITAYLVKVQPMLGYEGLIILKSRQPQSVTVFLQFHA